MQARQEIGRKLLPTLLPLGILKFVDLLYNGADEL